MWAGIPFFYWYQMLMVVIGGVLPKSLFANEMKRRERREGAN